IEVSVLSKKQLYTTDSRGNVFTIQRNEDAELEFTALLLKQHPDFYEQLHMQTFYLTKTQFFENDWFLDAMEIWRQENITVYGFRELGKNRFNEYKPVISVEVKSGTDWFDTNMDVRYGKQKASLRQLHKSIENKSNYVQLDDGSLGMLPAEWAQQFAAWFAVGEVAESHIRTPKISFASISELYDAHLLSPEVKQQLELYRSRLNNFESITPVPVPAALKTSLRSYQQQGLNWLNFLDDFGFGGCLADDMGLGKTIQVIAFMLVLRHKRPGGTHVIIVPTSLVFNWQQELEKFAPELKVLTLYGISRVKKNTSFSSYDVVLTSYGVLLSDIHFLKTFDFSYIFLDESQAIK
ncbi:MAG: DEAD/DEAH box helicase, partial [Sphingobacteriales bacterium]